MTELAVARGQRPSASRSHRAAHGTPRKPSAAPSADGGPFIDGYLAYLLARASHVVSTQFHAQVRAEGLSVLEWRVLATLADAEAVSVGQLADIVLAQQPTLTKLLARMESERLVRRVSDTADRRRTLVRITRAGRNRVARLIARARSQEAHILEPFGAERIEALKTVLRGLIEGSQASGKASGRLTTCRCGSPP